METDRLIIFPTERQIAFLESTEISGKIYIVVREKGQHENRNTGITFVDYLDAQAVEALKRLHLAVLCCHEEAIYWAGLHRSDNWTFPFDANYFSLLTKDRFKKFISDRNIPNAQALPAGEEPLRYPVIAKPRIGFGSIGVKGISDAREYQRYIAGFDEMVAASRIQKYQEIYFPNESNYPVLEHIVRGEFYRVPVILGRQGAIRVFPVCGVRRADNQLSNYHWTDFEFYVPDPVFSKSIVQVIHQLADCLKLQAGVYIAEFIRSEDNQIFLLEFSPRQTSERIGHIIYLATGVDMELGALSAFLSVDFRQEERPARTVRMVLGEDDPCTNSPEYKLIEEHREDTLYQRLASCRFYERLEEQ